MRPTNDRTDVRELLGHAGIRTTMCCVHVAVATGEGGAAVRVPLGLAVVARAGRPQESKVVPYIQFVELDGSHPAQEIRQALDDWIAAARGKRQLQMAIVAADHERPNHSCELLEFPPEDEFDRSVLLAAELGDAPLAPQRARHHRLQLLLAGDLRRRRRFRPTRLP